MVNTNSKLNRRQILFQPLYFPITSGIGFALVLVLFVWNYPSQNDPVGQEFVKVPEFWVWISLLGLMSAFLTIVFAPLWKQFIDLFKEQVSNQGQRQRLELILMISAGTVIYVFLMLHMLGQFTSFNKRKSYVADLRKAYVEQHPDYRSFQLPGDNYTPKPRFSRARWYVNALRGFYDQHMLPSGSRPCRWGIASAGDILKRPSP